MTSRPVAGTVIESVEVTTAAHANPSGTIHGGMLLQLVDRVGSIAGMRHSEGRCTTAAVDRVEFHTSSSVGDILTVRARVVDVGRTSMAVEVTIDAERVDDRQLRRIVTGHLTLVAVDEVGRPRRVPAIIPETDEERQAQAAARARRRVR